MPYTQLPFTFCHLPSVSNQRYLPFGEVRTVVGTLITQTDFGYTGQRNNTYIKLIDYGARWYSLSLGRFTQPDTLIPRRVGFNGHP
jgi:RHS repeat-associated protein